MLIEECGLAAWISLISEMNRRFDALYRADFCCVSTPCPSYSINQRKMSIASANLMVLTEIQIIVHI
ncbi:hypothetical protein T10_11390 [Trichinella papuae]|uniref:Uncharacterized protein n=1 Tax=Trichinella papuae TaxID=268474 RepID=A0A0V1MMB8_9BILA|nr:hypothetical protein T10_11390 [Trichinella papuae]